MESAVRSGLKPGLRAGAAELVVSHCLSISISVVLPEHLSVER